MEDENEYGDEEWDEAEASTSSAGVANEEPRSEENPAVGDGEDAASEQAYASEWSEQESPVRVKSDAIYPLSSMEQRIGKTVEAPNAYADAMAFESKASKVSRVDAGEESNESQTVAVSKKTYSESIVQSHAQRRPKGAPSEARRQPQSVDWGVEGARVAAERIRQFQELARLQDEQQKLAHMIQQQKRQQYRASNKPMHEALGIANISAQQRLEMLHREQRRQKKQLTNAAQIERKERWYNRPVEAGARVARCMAAAHVSSLHKREVHLQRGKQKVQDDRKREIHENLKKLQNRARSVIAKSQGAYVHGSYLLSRSHNQTPQSTEVMKDDRLTCPVASANSDSDSLESDDLSIPVSNTTTMTSITPTSNLVITTEHSNEESSASESALSADTELDNLSITTPTDAQALPPVASIDSAESPMAGALTNKDHPVQISSDTELDSAPETSPPDDQAPSFSASTDSLETSTAGELTNEQNSSDSFSDDPEASPVTPDEKNIDYPLPSTEIRDATPLDPPVTDNPEFLGDFPDASTASPEKIATDSSASLAHETDVVSGSFDYEDDFTT